MIEYYGDKRASDRGGNACGSHNHVRAPHGSLAMTESPDETCSIALYCARQSTHR